MPKTGNTASKPLQPCPSVPAAKVTAKVRAVPASTQRHNSLDVTTRAGSTAHLAGKMYGAATRVGMAIRSGRLVLVGSHDRVKVAAAQADSTSSRDGSRKTRRAACAEATLNATEARLPKARKPLRLMRTLNRARPPRRKELSQRPQVSPPVKLDRRPPRACRRIRGAEETRDEKKFH